MSSSKLWIKLVRTFVVFVLIFGLARLNFALQNFWRVKIFSRLACLNSFRILAGKPKFIGNI